MSNHGFVSINIRLISSKSAEVAPPPLFAASSKPCEKAAKALNLRVEIGWYVIRRGRVGVVVLMGAMCPRSYRRDSHRISDSAFARPKRSYTHQPEIVGEDDGIIEPDLACSISLAWVCGKIWNERLKLARASVFAPMAHDFRRTSSSRSSNSISGHYRRIRYQGNSNILKTLVSFGMVD